MSVIADVASEVLDFPNVKRRSVAARNYRVKINTVTPGTVAGSKSATLEFVLPSNLAGSYMDFSQLYLRFGMAPLGAGNNLDKCGAYGMISRVEVFSNSAQIMTLNNYNVLVSTLVDTDATIGYKGGVGKVLAGLQASGSLGEYMSVVAGDASTATYRTFCLPLILTPFAMQKKLVPLFSLDSIRIRITLEDYTNVFVGGGATTGYNVADAQLCGYVCELSGSAQQMVDNMTQGVYQLLCPCYQNIQTTMAASTTGVASSLGIAVSSLERILIVHRVTASNASLTKQSLGGRITNGLVSFQVNIDSQLYPQNPILVGTAGAEALAEYLISSHAISDFQNDAHIASQLYGVSYNVSTQIPVNAYEGYYSYLNIPATSSVSNAWFNAVGDGSTLASNAATGAVSTAGSFVAALELENSTSAARSDRLFSGVSTLGSVVQYLGTYAGGAGTVAATIDFFCHYTIMCTLNMRTVGVWQVQV